MILDHRVDPDDDTDGEAQIVVVFLYPDNVSRIK